MFVSISKWIFKRKNFICSYRILYLTGNNAYILVDQYKSLLFRDITSHHIKLVDPVSNHTAQENEVRAIIQHKRRVGTYELLLHCLVYDGSSML